MKRGLVALGVALALAPSSGRAAEPLRELSQRDVEVQGLSVVEVHNARGRIVIRGSRDRRLRISALKVVRGGSQERHRELARRTTVELGREGERFVIRVQYPKGRSTRVNLWEDLRRYSPPGVEVRIALEVPAAMSVRIHAASGDVATEGLEGAQSIRSVSGDVTVESSAGAVSVSSSSGDVELRDTGPLEVSSSSGDVRIEGARRAVRVITSSGDISVGEVPDSVTLQSVSGDIVLGSARSATLRTSSGEIEARGVTGRVRASSVSGRVRIGLRAPIREAEVSTSSGSIRVGLDGALGCVLDLRTSSGHLEIEVPVEARTVTRRHLVAAVGRGAAPVSLSSTSGNITVTRGGP